MYKQVVVLLTKPIVFFFFTFSLLSASLDLKVHIYRCNRGTVPIHISFLFLLRATLQQLSLEISLHLHIRLHVEIQKNAVNQ